MRSTTSRQMYIIGEFRRVHIWQCLARVDHNYAEGDTALATLIPSTLSQSSVGKPQKREVFTWDRQR